MLLTGRVGARCVQIEPREEQCFYEELTRDQQFRLEFEVVRGGLLDCKIKIADPNNVNIVDRIAYFNKEVTHTLSEHRGTMGERGAGTEEELAASSALTCAGFLCQTDAENESEGRVTFTAATAGRHSICFDNTMSRWTAKVVSFFVLNDNAANPKDSVAKLQDLGPTVDAVIKVTRTR
jgi:hypothetical protein